ncbi:hypothetical protein [Hyphomicrobium facile]|uniref:Uncharacterized protein n=1 Tax=Hyphomicrobium facile TaxID=51670 RepID=A0A1I7NFR2_9HYPH|nr:hypothetical protein [Hyphomicrobium facile]SFV33502.1 hypothetical protein SAMN04488557_2016 [Hyphomicrobium facile]
MSEFDPRNWFWIVAGDETKAWSSAARAFVTEYPADRLSRIANEVELYDVLARQYPVGAPSRTFTEAECIAALNNIDASVLETAVGNLNQAAASIGFNLPSIA